MPGTTQLKSAANGPVRVLIAPVVISVDVTPGALLAALTGAEVTAATDGTAANTKAMASTIPGIAVFRVIVPPYRLAKEDFGPCHHRPSPHPPTSEASA